MIYDYAIIGAGPSGLTLAYILQTHFQHTQSNKKIIIFDRENDIGGCHRVRRTRDYLFTEHGPRIYLGNYSILNTLFKENNLQWSQFFAPYKFHLTDSRELFQTFSLKEFITLFKDFLMFMVLPDTVTPGWKKTTLQEYGQTHMFSNETMDLLDKVCRLTDGAGVERYTVYEFFEIINQNMFYGIYQPNKPNDVGLFHWWRNQITNIFTNTDIVQVNKIQVNTQTELMYELISSEGGRFQAKNVIFAIPPDPLYKLLSRSQLTDAFSIYPPTPEWFDESRYFTYIPISYHWDTALKLKPVWGFPRTKWAVVFVNLSDYMTFESPQSKTVISALITKPTEETHRMNAKQLQDEVFNQLRVSYPELPMPTLSILSPGVYKETGKWKTKDTAFMFSPAGYAPFKQTSTKYVGLYNVGTHNGKSEYAFTSMQSAMENAVYLLKDLGYPQLMQKYTPNKLITLRRVLFILIIVLLGAFMYYHF